MRRYQYLYSLLVAAFFVVLQSTLIQKIAIYGVVPDLAMIVVVFSANSMGAMKGQTLGFFSGLIQDFLSNGPIGFNALVKTITGFLFGKIKGKLFLDSVLLPVIFIIIASVMKEIMMLITIVIFIPESGLHLFSKNFFIELGINAFISPFVFAFLKIIKVYRIDQKGSF